MLSQQKARRSSILCAPLWAASGSIYHLLYPTVGKKATTQKDKPVRSCVPKGRYRRCCSPIPAWSCGDTSPWSFFSFPKGDGEKAGEAEASVYLRFENQTESTARVYWFSHEEGEKFFYKLNAGCSITQETFSGNVWMVRDDTPSQRLLKRVKVCGQEIRRQLCYIRPVSEAKPPDPTVDEFPCPDLRIPLCYTRILETELGIPVVGCSEVSMASLHAAADIVRHMLEGCRARVLEELRSNQTKVAIIGVRQVTTDILEHSHLRGTATDDGRDWDVGVRGLGGTLTIPTCSVGEENVLRWKKDPFGQESILIHEFGHTVMEVGLTPLFQKKIAECYARNKHKYKPGIYMVADEKEYWAEGSQSWFDASRRDDVNDGINTREKLWKHDPELACHLREVYGDTPWKYDFTPIPAE